MCGNDSFCPTVMNFDSGNQLRFQWMPQSLTYLSKTYPPRRKQTEMTKKAFGTYYPLLQNRASSTFAALGRGSSLVFTDCGAMFHLSPDQLWCCCRQSLRTCGDLLFWKSAFTGSSGTGQSSSICAGHQPGSLTKYRYTHTVVDWSASSIQSCQDRPLHRTSADLASTCKPRSVPQHSHKTHASNRRDFRNGESSKVFWCSNKSLRYTRLHLRRSLTLAVVRQGCSSTSTLP